MHHRFTVILLVWSAISFGHPALGNEKVQTCFTPGQDCQGRIVREIESARSQVLVQAFYFSSKPIMQALGHVKSRGIDVRLISKRNIGSAGPYLSKFGIPILIDDRVKTAHNKVIIIDAKRVITGSFNFTKSAQEKNAENVVVINDKSTANDFVVNWNRRAAQSRPYTPADGRTLDVEKLSEGTD